MFYFKYKMSSWNGGKIHFRERRMPPSQSIAPIPPIVPQTSAENITVKPETHNNINLIPSRYVFSKPKFNDAVVCCIALNEEPYIDEWIRYNLALGFSHVYIYDNSPTNILNDKKSDKVIIIHFPGNQQQLMAYNHFIAHYNKQHKWVAFIDCDEFIFLKKHNNIMQFLNDYDEFNAIGINWLMFGTSNEREYRDEPVTSRFRYSANNINMHIKSIVKINKCIQMIDPHFPILQYGEVCNTSKKPIYSAFNMSLEGDIAVIHHYFTKSEEEFRKKIERGRADVPEKIKLSALDGIHTRDNDIYNSDAWDFYSKHL